MHSSSPQPSTCAAKSSSERCPGGAKLDLCAVALVGEFPVSGRDDLGGRAGCRGVLRAAGVEGIDQPGPGDIGEERVDADLGLERRLREADDPEWPAPGLGRGRVVEEDEAPGAEVGVGSVAGAGATSAAARSAYGARLPGAGISVTASSGAELGATQRIDSAARMLPGAGLRRVSDTVKTKVSSVTVREARRPERAVRMRRQRPDRSRRSRGSVIARGRRSRPPAASRGASSHFARTVVTPPRARTDDVRDPRRRPCGRRHASRSPHRDTVLPGRYGFWFDGERGHARRGRDPRPRRTTGSRATARGVDFGDARQRAERGRFSGWFYLGPPELGLPFEDVAVPTPLGAGAGLADPGGAAADATRWVIQVHGRAARRRRRLRAVPVFRDAGFTCLLVSYRNDGDAPPAPTAATGSATRSGRTSRRPWLRRRARGATDIVLMGWSMGGAIVLQAAHAGAQRDCRARRRARFAGRRLGADVLRLPGARCAAARGSSRAACSALIEQPWGAPSPASARRSTSPGSTSCAGPPTSLCRSCSCTATTTVRAATAPGPWPRRVPTSSASSVHGREAYEALELRSGALERRRSGLAGDTAEQAASSPGPAAWCARACPSSRAVAAATPPGQPDGLRVVLRNGEHLLDGEAGEPLHQDGGETASGRCLRAVP